MDLIVKVADRRFQKGWTLQRVDVKLVLSRCIITLFWDWGLWPIPKTEVQRENNETIADKGKFTLRLIQYRARTSPATLRQASSCRRNRFARCLRSSVAIPRNDSNNDLSIGKSILNPKMEQVTSPLPPWGSARLRHFFPFSKCVKYSILIMWFVWINWCKWI